MKIHRLVMAPKESGAIRGKLLTVCFFFVVGAVLGFVLHGMVTPTDDSGLREYVLQYAGLAAQQEDTPASLLSAALTYFRYPLLLMLLGQITAGLALIPVLCIFQGCSLAFSVACFASALGRGGVLLALAAFGMRYLVLLPCTFLLAADYLNGAQRHLTARTGKRAKKDKTYISRHYGRLALCFCLLLLGVIAELTIVPILFRLILSQIIH